MPDANTMCCFDFMFTLTSGSDSSSLDSLARPLATVHCTKSHTDDNSTHQCWDLDKLTCTAMRGRFGHDLAILNQTKSEVAFWNS